MMKAIYDGEVAMGSPTAGLATASNQTSFSARNRVIEQHISASLPPEGQYNCGQ